MVNLLDPEAYRGYAARPERLRELVRGNPARQRILIDEVQRVPELLSVVHSLIEQSAAPAPQFILAGSSARKVRRAGVDLLAGRALLRHMHPFVAAELGGRFDLEIKNTRRIDRRDLTLLCRISDRAWRRARNHRHEARREVAGGKRPTSDKAWDFGNEPGDGRDPTQ